MKKTTREVTVYTFDDMDVYVITTDGTADVYATAPGYALQYQFGISADHLTDELIENNYLNGNISIDF